MLFNTKDSSTLLGALTQISTSKKDIGSYQTVIDDIKNNSNADADWFKSIDISTQYAQMSDSVRTNLQNIQDDLNKTGASGQEAIGKINVSMQETTDKAGKATSTISKLGKMVANAFASFAITTAISLVIQGIQNLINSYELLAKKTQEIAQTYQTSKQELTDYGNRIKELRGIMEDETSTTEEVRDATSQLYDIQSDLIGTYGAYHDGIDLVNGDLETQLGLLRQINEENSQRAVNDINAERSALSSGANVAENIGQMLAISTTQVGSPAAAFLYGKKVYENLKSNKGWGESLSSAFTESDLFGRDTGIQAFGNSVEQITETWENFEATIKATDDEKINRLIDSVEGLSVVGDEIKVAGEVDDINESVTKLQAKLKQLGYEDEGLSNGLEDIYKKTQDIINSSSAQYELIKENDIINGDNAKLTSYYYALTAKNADIQAAKTEGETEKVEELEEQYKQLLTTISEDPAIADKYLEYFLDMYPELQDIISEWTFEVKVIPEIQQSDVSDGLKDFLNNNSTEYIQAEYDRYLAPGYVDKKGYSAYFKELEEAAHLAKQDVDTLVESLHKTDEYRVSGKNSLLYQPTQTSYTGIEDTKIDEWEGVAKYAEQIKNGTLQTKFGNVDMDNRDIIEWNDWNLMRFQAALKSWGTAFDEQGNMVRSYYDDLKETVDEGYDALDTVWGASGKFEEDGVEYNIAFTPIMQTENGAVFLSQKEVYTYIQSVLDKAAEDGKVDFDEILTIDAQDTGKQYGALFGKGLIAGIGEYTGEGGQYIPAETVGSLMHFSGQYGAYSLAKTGEGQGNYVTASPNRMTYDTLYKQDMTYLTEEEEAHNELISKWYEGLSDEAKAYFDGIADTLSEEEIAPTFKMNNEFELSNWLYKLQHEADENPIEIKFKTSDLVEDLDTLEDKWDSLSTAYESSVTNAKTISATDLQAVTDDFGGIGADEKTGKYNALSSALEKYNEELVKNPGDTTVAQNATDRLATAYLDLTGTLEDLIEEDADYAEEVLKANGVENAHEVVTSRLGKVYKGTRKNLEDLAEAVAQWSDNLDDTDQNSQHFLDGLDGIRDSVSNLIALYDENGDVIASSIPELDNDFLISNLDDIKAATEGDVEALDRLYVALARVNAEQVYVDAGLDTSEFSADLAEIESFIAYANTLDIENDAYINDSQFMATLQKLLSSSSETASAVEAALSSIGIKISYKTTPKKIKVATDGSGSHVSTVYGGANAGKTVSWDYIDVDEFEVVATKTGSTGSTGTGVKNYSGSTDTSSGSGGSGDSGGSDDTSTDEETFDWVETAINSLEQDLDRLDEAIDDVYDKWDTRNEALANKIQTVTDEIELQQNAAQRYEAEAEKYNDIGADYIQKIKEGILDIETLEVETSDDDDSDTLIEKIQNYQTWLIF